MSPKPKNCRGKIRVAQFLFEEEFDCVALLLRDIVVVHVEFRADLEEWHFIGISRKFEPVPEGNCIPEYQGLFRRKDDGTPELLKLERVG